MPVPELAQALGIPPGEAAKLKKSSYGLVDAPWEWYCTVVTTLKELGWVQCESDPCACMPVCLPSWRCILAVLYCPCGA